MDWSRDKMLTNIYRIGGLHQVSWFELVPDLEQISPTVSRNETGRQDVETVAVIMAHMRLQDEGHFSSWTVWSGKEGSLQRAPTSDDKVKLWIFSPGLQDGLNPSVLPFIGGLKVLGAGHWCAPGDNEEVGAAFCEALRNRLERALKGFSYVRFGDVFVKCRRHGALESRKVLPTCELVFMGSEDALFVHVVIRQKRVRLLAASDMQYVVAQQYKKDSPNDNSLAVVVAPYGSSGRLTGSCPGDLVTQLYRSKLQAFTASSLPFRVVSSSTNGGGAVQSCYAEIQVGLTQGGVEQAGQPAGSQSNADSMLDQARIVDNEAQVKAMEGANIDGRSLIYPLEAVLAPVLPPIPARTYLRRCWLQEWAGTHWLEDSAIPDLNWLTISNGAEKDTSKVLGVLENGAEIKNSSSSSSSSGSSGSSIKSSSSRGSGSYTSGSSTSGESEVGNTGLEFEADADSLSSKVGFTGGNSLKHSTGTNLQSSAQNADIVAGNSGSKRNHGKLSGLSEEPPNKKLSTSPSLEISTLLEGVGNVGAKKGGGSLGDMNIQGTLSIGAGTPRDVVGQVGTPWDWTDDGMGLGLGMGMDMQADADILAEFGDFGDFFEDDGLHFGEPPGTAESQSLMFDYVDGVSTPGTVNMDGPDPMLLPILDFPTLEGFAKPLGTSSKEQSGKGMKITGNEFTSFQGSGQFSPLAGTTVVTVDPLSKSEAMLLFAPGYARVEIPSAKEEIGFSSSYIPESRKVSQIPSVKDAYVYGALPPPPRTHLEIFDDKSEKTVKHQDNFGDAIIVGDQRSVSKLASNVDSFDDDSIVTSNIRDEPHLKVLDKGLGSNGPFKREPHISTKVEDGSVKSLSALLNLDERIFPRSKFASPVLATELDCAMVQISMLCAKNEWSPSSVLRTGSTMHSIGSLRSSIGVVKDEIPHVQVDQMGRSFSKPPQALKRKALPSRIAGDTDEDVQDGLRGPQVGVWRPVQAPKPQKLLDTGNLGLEGDLMSGGVKPNQWQSVVDAIPLLAQQAAVAYDIALDGEFGDGPLGWLEYQERQRCQSSCGPGLCHAGCGGMFSIRHSVDNAGVEYVDPLAAEVSPATVANLLQTDFRVAVAAAFGEFTTDGPLTALDWCRPRFQGDGTASAGTDSKEGTSTVTSLLGEPMGLPQGISSNAIGLKGSVGLEDLDQRRGIRSMETSSLSDQPRGDEGGTNDSDLQAGNSSYGATMVAMPVPALLVGYQEDWLKMSPNVLRVWEKAPLEPYAPPKPVSYYVVCLGLDSLVNAANDFFQQLSSVYESCRLGSHAPGSTVGLPGINSGVSKQSAPGFMTVDAPPQPVQSGSAIGLMGDFMAGMDSSWSMDDFRKALLRICRVMPVSPNPVNVQRDAEQSQCTVVYIVSPSSEPVDLLQIILDASQSLGTALSEKDRRAMNYIQVVGTPSEEAKMSPVVGFSIPRFVLQVLPAEAIMKASGTVTSQLDLLKEVAFSVYSKARRIQRKTVVPDSAQSTVSSSRVRSGMLQSGPSLPGMWKDCNTVRSSGVSSVLDPVSHRNTWDGGWSTSASRFGDSSLSDGGSLVGELQNSHEAARFLYEPLFILAEPGFPDPGANHQSTRASGKDSARSSSEDATGITAGLTAGLSDSGLGAGGEGADTDSSGAGHQQVADLHCCYTWTEDWQWLVSVWTDARGELLDIQVLPLVGAQKDSGFQNFFSQILQQGLQLLSMAVEAGSQHPRNIVISHLGGFTQRESQEWYRTIMTVGGEDSRKWPVQMWPGAASGNSAMQDMGFISDRTLGLATSGSRPPSPSLASTFGSRSKSSQMPFNQPRRQGQGLGTSQLMSECKGPFQWVNSISLVSVHVEHCLQTVSMSEISPPSGMGQGGATSSTWPANSAGNASSTSVTGVSTVKTLANMGASYMMVPTNLLRPISPKVWQLPAVHSATAPLLAQLLQGSLICPPLASAFVVSPPTPSPMSEFVQQAIKEEWPSTLYVGLIAMSGNFFSADSAAASSKLPKDFNKELFQDAHGAVQFIAAQLHALSWLTISPTILLRHSPLPFHCNIAQRFCRLLSYLDVELGYPQLPQSPM